MYSYIIYCSCLQQVLVMHVVVNLNSNFTYYNSNLGRQNRLENGQRDKQLASLKAKAKEKNLNRSTPTVLLNNNQ
jgi:hypothetical protein